MVQILETKCYMMKSFLLNDELNENTIFPFVLINSLLLSLRKLTFRHCQLKACSLRLYLYNQLTVIVRV